MGKPLGSKPDRVLFLPPSPPDPGRRMGRSVETRTEGRRSHRAAGVSATEPPASVALVFRLLGRVEVLVDQPREHKEK